MNESERQTRKKRIDTRLLNARPPWKIVRYRDGLDLASFDEVAVEEFPTANGPADYALFVRGKLLGTLEAKKVTVNPQNALEQAKRYATGATNGCGNWNGLRVPFLYATNGELIWHLDSRSDKLISRSVADFHTAPALAEMFALDGAPCRKWLLDTAPEKIAKLRPYNNRKSCAGWKICLRWPTRLKCATRRPRRTSRNSPNPSSPKPCAGNSSRKIQTMNQPSNCWNPSVGTTGSARPHPEISSESKAYESN